MPRIGHVIHIVFLWIYEVHFNYQKSSKRRKKAYTYGKVI